MDHAEKSRQAIRRHPLGQRLGRRRLYRASSGRTADAGDGIAERRRLSETCDDQQASELEAAHSIIGSTEARGDR
jgi:hypothetical protein